MSAAKRDRSIDILKGIGILLMVLGHASFPGRNFVYLFHMAIFFMATGFLFKDSHSDSIVNVGKYIWKRVLTLWLPFVLADTIFNLLNNFFRAIHIYSTSVYKEELPWGGKAMVMPTMKLSAGDIWERFLNALRFRGSAEPGMAMWFLVALFGMTVLFILTDYLTKKIAKFIAGLVMKNKEEKKALAAQIVNDVLMGGIAVVFLLIGSNVKGMKAMAFGGFEKSFTCFILMYLGRLLHRYVQKGSWGLLKSVMASIAGLVVLILMKSHGQIELSSNIITNPVFFIIVSLAGWFFIYGIARVIEVVGQKKALEVLPRCFALIGLNSLAIVILHLLAFRIVNTIVVAVYSLPIETLAIVPSTATFGAWWILYGIVGIAVPVLLNTAKKRIKKAVMARK